MQISRTEEPMTDFIHIRAATGECAVHEWPTEGMAIRLVKAMKRTHPVGIQVCRACVSRAKQDADNQRSK